MKAAGFFGRILYLLMDMPSPTHLADILQMIRFNRLNQRAALCALLLCLSLSSAADEIQDANSLFKLGEYTQALLKVDAVLANQPKDVQARFLKGVILTEQGQTDAALRIFGALTEDHPELPEPYNNLAVLYAGQGQYEKAKVALEAALRTHPSYATAHENLGDIYAKMASQAYDRALQLDRTNTSSKTKLALLKNLYNPEIKPSGNKTHLAAASKPATVASDPVNPPTASAPVAATSAPAVAGAEPTTAKPVVAKTIVPDSKEEILKALHEWASAWSSKNLGKYFAMYAQSFKTANNETRSSWEKERRIRIDKPQAIVVSISHAKISLLGDSHASVSFIQSYRSGTLKSTTRKTMEMIKTNGKWQIQSEQAGGKR